MSDEHRAETREPRMQGKGSCARASLLHKTDYSWPCVTFHFTVSEMDDNCKKRRLHELEQPLLSAPADHKVVEVLQAPAPGPINIWRVLSALGEVLQAAADGQAPWWFFITACIAYAGLGAAVVWWVWSTCSRSDDVPRSASVYAAVLIGMYVVNKFAECTWYQKQPPATGAVVVIALASALAVSAAVFVTVGLLVGCGACSVGASLSSLVGCCCCWCCPPLAQWLKERRRPLQWGFRTVVGGGKPRLAATCRGQRSSAGCGRGQVKRHGSAWCVIVCRWVRADSVARCGLTRRGTHQGL